MRDLIDIDEVIQTSTLDHTVKNKSERRRVEYELGGYVSEQGHVMGDIAVTRALGDLKFLPYVTNEPSVLVCRRKGTEILLIVACDGLWDCISNEEAYRLVSTFVLKGGDPSQAALMLRDYALSMGSLDNISVIVVFLQN